MEHITDIYTGPCSSESKYIKPFRIFYKQVLVPAQVVRLHTVRPISWIVRSGVTWPVTSLGFCKAIKT